MVVHKTSSYGPEEEEGFRSAAEARVPACELVWMRSTRPLRAQKDERQDRRAKMKEVNARKKLLRLTPSASVAAGTACREGISGHLLRIVKNRPTKSRVVRLPQLLLQWMAAGTACDRANR